MNEEVRKVLKQYDNALAGWKELKLKNKEHTVKKQKRRTKGKVSLIKKLKNGKSFV